MLSIFILLLIYELIYVRTYEILIIFKMKILISLLLLAGVLCRSASKQAQEQISVRWSDDDLFFYGMLAGAFVSLIGFIAAFLLLCGRKVIPENIYTIIIQILFSFSCGALLGQTMLHILPQAYASRYLKDQQVSLTFIAAILSFIILERFLHRLGISDHHWHGEDAQQNVQQNHRVTQKRKLQEQKGNKTKEVKVIKQTTGFLNLISSLLHNFVDGLAIGIAFNLGNPKQFLPVTYAIIAHQIPRQMGDVAILLKSNFNPTETILSNGFVNLISLVGVWLGLNSHDLSPTAKQYCLVFVAGNFLYIASDIWKNLFHNKSRFVDLLELGGLGMGVYLALH